MAGSILEQQQSLLGTGGISPTRRPPVDDPDSRGILIRAVLGELVSTTLFMYANMSVALTANEAIFGPFTVGVAGVAMIYAFADVSGAHFNPAVTVGTIVGFKTSLLKGALYILAQLIGSILATLFASLSTTATGSLSDHFNALVLAPVGHVGRAFLMEVITSCFLVLVIFSVVFDTLDTRNVEVLEDATADGHVHKVHARGLTLYTATGTSKSAFAPLAIGASFAALAAAGGCFNPARVFGPSLLSWNGKYVWVYFVADLLGGALGALIQRGFHVLKHRAVEREEQAMSRAV